jgi:hypothetical protein
VIVLVTLKALILIHKLLFHNYFLFQVVKSQYFGFVCLLEFNWLFRSKLVLLILIITEAMAVYFRVS